MKTRILQFVAAFCCMFWAVTSSAQVEGVSYFLKFNTDSCWYDAHIVINRGSASTTLHRTQFNAQMTLVVPAGDTVVLRKSHAPYYNNQAGGNTTLPMTWTVTTRAFAPAAMPGKDFYSVVPTLFPTSQFEDLNSGDTVKLFSFTVESYANCGSGIRFFENGSDPGPSDPGMGNGDFSNGYTVGGLAQLYEDNIVSQHPPVPVLVDPPLVSCGAGISIDLDATTSGCQAPLAYAWTGPNYSGTSQDVTINPALTTDAGLYKVVVTDAYGCKDSLDLMVDNKPDAGPDYTLCAGLTQAITGSQPSTGTWSALGTNPLGATMGSSVAGVANIVFTNAASGVYTFIYSTVACSDTMQFTINPLPSVAITGSTSICFGTTTTLSPTSGGTWASNNTAVATVNPATGVVTPVAQGQANFTFTNTAGCSNTTSNVIVNQPPAVAAARDTICIGTTTTLSPPNTTGTWQGFNPGIATISGFTVTGIANGTAKFVYTENGTGCKSDTLRITVRPRPTVTATPGAICIQANLQLTPSSGGTWSTSNGAVASITNAGLITGITAGTATFTFTDASTGCISDPTGSLTVNPNPTVTLSAAASCVGITRTATGNPSAGTWVSNNPSIATIHPTTGVITPVSQGQTTFVFTATATGCSRTSNTFIVNPPPTVSVVLDTICVGNTTNLSPSTGGSWTALTSSIASLSSGTLVTGLSAGMGRFRFTQAVSGCQAFDTVIVLARPVIGNGAAQICVGSTTNLTPNTGGSWQSSNGSIATIANTGLVTGVSVGTVTFTFTSTAGCQSLASSPVTVNNAPIVSLQGAPFLCQSSTRQLSPSTGGTWTSNNTAVATITSGGLVTAVGAGAASFTFTQSGSGCQATTGNLTVSLPPTITNTGAGTICVGLTTVLQASTTGTWFAVTPSIATISNTGVVTGIAAGTANFTFTDGNGCTSAQFSVVVQTAVTTSVTGPLVICIGGTTNLSPTSGGSWASLNTSVASVTPAGVVTGVGAGTAEFEFTSTSGCPSARVTSISVEPTPTVSNGLGRVCVGSTMQLSPSTGGTWTANQASLATVSSSGLVTGVSAGSATFVFTTTAGCPSNATNPVTVNNIPTTNLVSPSICIGRTTNITPSSGGTWVKIPAASTVANITNAGLITGVSAGTINFAFTQTSTGCTSAPSALLTVTAGPTVNVPDTELCIGETTTLTLTPATTGGTWSSTNPTVASISSGGVVTALAQGQSRFIYTDASGCQSEQSVAIVVNPRPTVAISGNPFICITGTTTLSPSTGGNWVSNNPSVATVVASTGVVTGVSAGTATFTFTDSSTGCVSDATLPVTVEGAPSVSITGPTEVCINGTTTLSPNTGGTWVSNNIAVATVHPNTGVVTAVGPGSATFTFTQNNTGCPAAATGPITVVQCLNPDFNATFVNIIVPGDVSTNDFGNGSSYGPTPLLVSSPLGSVPQIGLNSDGTYEFQANMVGVYKYLVPVCKAPQTSGCPTSDLWITVVDYKEPIKRPIAAVDIATTAHNTPVTLRTMENDDCEYVTGCSLDPASVAIITNPSRGTVTAINPATGDITYTPNNGYVGQDTLVYTVCVTGEPSNCAQAKQIITVNATGAVNSTVAADDFVVTPREVAVSGNVKTNDYDPQGHTTTVTAQTTTKTGGVLVLGTDGSYTFTPAVGFFGPVEFPYTICDNQSPAACADATLHILVVPDLAVKIRVYLEGALMANANSQASDGRPLMRDNLRVSPFTGQNYIPTIDPFKTATDYINVTSKYSHVAPGNRSDFGTIPNPTTVFAVTGQNAIVDWVFVQLRSKTNGTAVLATRSGLLQRDGDVVDLNGIEDLRFPGIPMDDYFVTVRHHRHLGVMTAAAQTPVQLTTLVNFTKPADLPTFDFGTPSATSTPNVARPTFANNGQTYTGLSQNTNIKTGYAAMWGGDFDSNKKIKAENPNDDINVLYFDVFAYPNNTTNNVNYDFAYGYLPGDFDMNSKSKFDNPNDDKNMLFSQLITYPLNGSLLSNFDFFIEQLP